MSNTIAFPVARSIDVDAPAAKVWSVLTDEFGDADVWASAVHKADFQLSASGDMVGSQRVCETTLGTLNETVVRYDAENMVFAYQAQGLPPFVTKAVNNWTVTANGDDRAHVEMRLEMEMAADADPQMIEGMKHQIGMTLTEATEELKHYVEAGTPHARKLEAQGA